MLHEAQSLQHSSQADSLSLSFPDGTAFQCICGRPNVTDHIVQCIQCKSWQHVLCYYPPGYGPKTHECLMCKSEASMFMPTRDERPPRLRTPSYALATGGSGMIDHGLPSVLRDTARAIDSLLKSDIDLVRRFEWLPAERRSGMSFADYKSTPDSVEIETRVRDASTKSNPVVDNSLVPLEPWSPLGQQHNKRSQPPGASVYTKCGPRASTPQVHMRTYHDWPPANRSSSRNWPNDRKNTRAQTPEDSSESMGYRLSNPGAKLAMHTSPESLTVVGPRLPVQSRSEASVQEIRIPSKNNPYKAYVVQRGTRAYAVQRGIRSTRPMRKLSES
jgi:hypothetical protein